MTDQVHVTFLCIFSLLYTLLTYLRARYLLLVHISPQCEMSVFSAINDWYPDQKGMAASFASYPLGNGTFPRESRRISIQAELLGILERKVYTAFQKHRLSLLFHYALLVLQLGIFVLEIKFHLTCQYFFLAHEDFFPDIGLYMLPALETIPAPSLVFFPSIV